MGSERYIPEAQSWHRLMTGSAETAAVTGAERDRLAVRFTNARDHLFNVMGSQKLELRFWGSRAASASSNNLTCSVTVVAWPQCPRRSTNETQTTVAEVSPKGAVLWAGDIVFGTDIGTAAVHPITGVPEAARNFHDADTIATTITGTSAVALIDVGGADRQSRVILGTDGEADIFVYVTTKHADLERVDVSVRRVG